MPTIQTIARPRDDYLERMIAGIDDRRVKVIAGLRRCGKSYLKGFAKVKLAPGETKRVCMTVGLRDLAYYDVLSHRFRTDAGEYRLVVGRSAA